MNATIGLALALLATIGADPPALADPPQAPSALSRQAPAEVVTPLAPSLPNVPGSPRAPASVAPARSPAVSSSVAARPTGLFDLPDATPIRVGGRASTAGALKQAIRAQIAQKAGPRHTVKVPPRVLDQSLRASPAHARTSVDAIANPALITKGPSALSRDVQASASDRGQIVRSAFCTDHAPPSISEVDGVVRPGGQVVVYGTCFGDRAGRVEVMGQFGTVVASFTSWQQTGIDVQVPATIRNVGDGSASITVVDATGRRSPAMQARFAAARTDVEVPARLWQATANFDVAATTDGNGGLFGGGPPVNPAAAGQLVRALRINPMCALESMAVDVVAGDVSAIDGFDRGPPNEVTTTIAWTGTCIDTRTTTTTDYVIGTSQSVSISKACRVSLIPRAWASCPVGMTP